MSNSDLVGKINRTIEEIWIVLETKERSYSQFKLNGQQHVLLTLLIHEPDITATELADRMNISKSAISQQLTRLENEGYIIRVKNQDDRRGHTIELADKGVRYRKESEDFQKKISEKYSSQLTTEELTNMLSTLQKLLEIIV